MTDTSGHYLVPLLGVADYSIRVDATGFKPAESKDVRLQIDEHRELDFKLVPASVNTSVEVSAAEANGGSSWSAQTSGVTSTLQSVWCASSSDCWAVGASGKILATTNGGSSWASQTSGVTGTLYGVACNSTSACLAVGASGKILTTANSGSTWSSQTSGTTNQLNAISCASSSLCWAVGASGTILATTNGGSSWASQTSGTTNQLMGVFCLTGACWADGVSGTIVAAKAPANTAAPSITGNGVSGAGPDRECGHVDGVGHDLLRLPVAGLHHGG